MEITKEKAIRLAVISVGAMFIASCASPTYPDLANAQQNNTLIPGNAIEEKNKALVLKAFDTLFNQRDYVAAESYWPPHTSSIVLILSLVGKAFSTSSRAARQH